MSDKKVNKEEILYTNLNEIAAEMSARLDAERPPWEPRDHSQNNWSSEVHHPCLKSLVHCRVDWKQKQGIDLKGRWRVEEGIDKEWAVKKWLGDIGFELSHSQKRYSTDDPGMEKFKHLHLSGKIDGLCPLNRALPEPFSKLKEVKAEIKTVNPNYWESTKTIEDIKKHSKFWIQKIPSQLNNYLFMDNSPGGLLIIASFGKPLRILPMLVDQELWEYDMNRIMKVNAHVEAGTYPEPIPYDSTVCGMCDFNHLCAPLKSTDIIDESEVNEMELQVYKDMEEQAKQFKEMHADLIGSMEKPGKYFGKSAFVGNYEINTTRGMRKKYPGIPKELKKPYEVEYELIQTKIERIGK